MTTSAGLRDIVPPSNEKCDNGCCYVSYLNVDKESKLNLMYIAKENFIMIALEIDIMMINFLQVPLINNI